MATPCSVKFHQLYYITSATSERVFSRFRTDQKEGRQGAESELFSNEIDETVLTSQKEVDDNTLLSESPPIIPKNIGDERVFP